MLEKIRFYQLEKQNLSLKTGLENTLILLKEHLALHSTDYLTPYLSLWARVKDFAPEILFQALSDTREAFRLRALRGTIFVIHRDNLASIMGALDHFRGQRYKDIARLFQRSGADFATLEQAILALIKEQGALTITDIKKNLLLEYKPELFPVMMRHLEFQGALARAGQRYISDKVIKYCLVEDWVPGFNRENIDPAQSLRDLSFKYIQKFGPVCLDDLCWWLPLTRSAGRNVIKELDKEIKSFDFRQREYYMARGDYENLMAYQVPKKVKPQVHFLPYEDHFPKAYSVRAGFISTAALPLVFQIRRVELGQLRPTIWLNGGVIGRWEREWVDGTKTRQKVTVIDMIKEPVLSAPILSLIEQKRLDLETFINERLVPMFKSLK